MCLDRLQIQEALEWGVYERLELGEQGRYDEILAWLDEFEKANRHRDHDGWMARSIAASRQHFLWEAERYEESLAACEKVEQLGFENITYRWAAGSAKAHVLEDMGRHAEALAVFEEVFREQDPRFLSGARYYMRPLVLFCENAGKPVDESWREVVQNVADEYEVEFPDRPTLGESIVALFELTENKKPKREREYQAQQAQHAKEGP